MCDLVELVILARNGDRKAYGELVASFQPTVYGLALTRLRNPAEAQDLAQEVFVHAMTKLGQLRDPQCFAGWLRQITLNLALNRLSRRRAVVGVDNEVLENAYTDESGPLDEMVRQEEKAALWDGLNRLKEEDRATLVAFYIQGRSIKEMSRDFETPVGTIKRRLHVARHRLRGQLERGSKSSPRPPRSAKRGPELAKV